MFEGRRPLWAVVIAVLMLALPAAAQAAPTWHLMPDPAPGGVEGLDSPPRARLAVADGRPYVATVSQAGQLTVHTLTSSGNGWRQVGGALNRRPVVGFAEIASGGGTVWVAWREQAANGLTTLHVARLWRGRFTEIKGGLSKVAPSGAHTFSLAVFGGRPYVAYLDAAGRLRVVALAAHGRHFEQVNAGLPGGGVLAAYLQVAGGRLYVAYTRGTQQPETTQVSRLTTNRRSWQTVASEPAPASDGRVTDVTTDGTSLYVAVGGVVKRLTASGQFVQVDGQPFEEARATSIGYAAGVLYAFGKTFPAPDVTEPHLAAFAGGTWQPAPEPEWEGFQPTPPFPGDVDIAEFVTSGGDLWFLWDYGAGEQAFERYIHVARFGN